MEDKLRKIIESVQPDVEFAEDVAGSIHGVDLDSYDIILILNEIESEFGTTIDGLEVVPENFSSLATLRALVQRSLGQHDS